MSNNKKQKDQIYNPYKTLLQEDINNIQSIEDAAPLIKALKIEHIKQLLQQAIQMKDTDFHRSFALKSVSINKIIPNDVFMNHILSYLPLLLPCCKVNGVNKHWNKMCTDWIRLHYNKLIKILKEQEEKDNNNNNTYDDKINNTWLMYSIISCNKWRLKPIEKELKLQTFKPILSNIKDGDRIILFPGTYSINGVGNRSIFKIRHSVSIIGIYPQTILKLRRPNPAPRRARIGFLLRRPNTAPRRAASQGPEHMIVSTLFLLGNHNHRLNVFIKNIKVEGVKMYSFCDVTSSINLSIDNCSINYKYYGIQMHGYSSKITINNTSFYGNGPCVQMNIRGKCYLNMRNCDCFVDYGLLHYTNSITQKRESFIIGPTTNWDSSFIGRVQGGCISIQEISDDDEADLDVCCQGNIFESDIYPIGITSMNGNNLIDKSHKLKDNKWNFYQPRINDNFDAKLMCSSSKCGSKCLLPSDGIISLPAVDDDDDDDVCNSPNVDACDGCGDQTHALCFYQGNTYKYTNQYIDQEPPQKLCYMCHVIQIQKSSSYNNNNNKDIPVTTIHSTHKIMDEICQHEFKQAEESDRGNLFENVTQCCKCSKRLNQNISRWHCGNNNASTFARHNDESNSHRKTKLYCHMTICQQCYNDYGSDLNPK